MTEKELKATGIIGVYETRAGTFQAMVSGKSLGRYPTIEQATEVRRAAEIQRGIDPDRPRKNHQFQPGHKGGGNRKSGQLNKITRDLKTGIIDAAVTIGEDGKGKGGLVGYLRFLARRHPKCFVQLLGKIIPLQVSGTLEAFIGPVNITPVPSNLFIPQQDAVAQFGNVVQLFEEPEDDHGDEA